MSRVAVIHIPYELKADANIAPQLRPRRMIEAFRAVGFTVIVVDGAPRRRRALMKRVLRDFDSHSLNVDFVYSESAGWPNAVSDGRKGSFHPYLDERFLRGLRARGVPVGVFYRDAYHRSDQFYQVPRWKRPLRHALRFLAERDLRRYNAYVSLLYLPSKEMAAHIPEYKGKIEALPPGAKPRSGDGRGAPDSPQATPLTLLYVGGLGALYKIHNLLEAVSRTPSIELVICTREADWASVESEYQPYLGPRISVVHKSGMDLEELYRRADVAMLMVEPHPYREFAVPVKLYEYIGSGLPIMASAGTLVGRYVEESGLGWVVPYSTDRIADILAYLATAQGEADRVAARARVQRHALGVTWEARARQVVIDLADEHSRASSVMQDAVHNETPQDRL
ncbi:MULTISPECIES: glycosyltransferase [Microbacterium]|uniref:glycosyltransferase n=1 Tax=Microbacterium TaxID=33882 RepID=UPI0028EF63BF|nr:MULTISPECIES: glycosyltransferase [Microbacterium]